MLHQPTAAASDSVHAGDETAPDAFLARYLARIGYRGALAPTLDVLAALQAAHIAAIPFEAIDALTGAGVDIGAAAVEAKLIGQRRGGYCFEQNGLFLRALRAIGFEAEGLIGRVRWMLPDDAPPTPRSHMVVRVKIDGRAWLADVGFGAAVPPQPLAMDDEAPQPTRHESYRIVRQGAEWQVAALIESEWRTLYRIEDAPPPAIDYEVGNWYTSAHPDSHFRHQLIAARTSAEARYGLRDNRLTVRLADGRIDRRYLTADEIERVLAEIFLLPVARHWRPAIERAATAEIAG
ncbi:arylamine N-acetyltransferase family protein [Sphingopyxis sp. FD7]|jgi:N-hydroxyarylamine O-acetyltransferase|uniref:arylamine N-acetyltransferase family protein n=1 Tax=Sphingopyxis sp. FD7 TaxID=1914525 RepID=UPI000DC6364F|nr:arylamine N-acetyltransferase [Sphingopyxis sp. FD7]BBB10783.1 arylamine N-acetyltransferase [Sphingopyxis sp. FD7]